METTVSNPDKRVNIISFELRDTKGEVIQQAGIIMRTTRSYAAKLIAAGTHTPTSKGKLKSYLNKSQKLLHNEKSIRGIDLTNKKLGHLVFNDPYNGRRYILLKKKEKEVTLVNKREVNPLTGLPMSYTINLPMYQRLIASYPTNVY